MLNPAKTWKMNLTIPDHTHRRIKAQAALQGHKVPVMVIKAIDSYLNELDKYKQGVDKCH